MSKQAIFFASTVTGLALFGAIGLMQVNPRAFASGPQVDLDSYLYSEVPKPVSEAPKAMPREPAATPAPEPGVITMPPVEVFARPTPSTPAEPAVREATVPCSPWRELGPRHVDDGKPSGAIQVRDLC
jgi:hypothetical protein